MKKKVVIRYKGGLGNQMFQYSMKVRLESEGIEVFDDLTHYFSRDDKMPFELNDIFENINIHNIFKSTLFTRIIRRICKYCSIYEKEKYFATYDDYWINNLFKFKWIEGYWQSYKYCQPVRNDLLKSFEFPNLNNNILFAIKEEILSNNSVSIHIRGGDYLNVENYGTLGKICNEDYYKSAVNYIKSKTNNPVFFVFSDDEKFARKFFVEEDKMVFISNIQIEEKKDWVDMYLMSNCKHNIIANSSFSWWGAWLNQNEEKIVVCPQKWTKDIENIDVCPKTWIRL